MEKLLLKCLKLQISIYDCKNYFFLGCSPWKVYWRDHGARKHVPYRMHRQRTMACSGVPWTCEGDKSGHLQSMGYLWFKAEERRGETDWCAANIRRPDVHWRTSSGDIRRTRNPWSNHQDGGSSRDWEIRPNSDEQSELFKHAGRWAIKAIDGNFHLVILLPECKLEKIRSREMTMRKRKANVRQRQMRRLRALAQWWPVEPRWRWADCVNLSQEPGFIPPHQHIPRNSS